VIPPTAPARSGPAPTPSDVEAAEILLEQAGQSRFRDRQSALPVRFVGVREISDECLALAEFMLDPTRIPDDDLSLVFGEVPRAIYTMPHATRGIGLHATAALMGASRDAIELAKAVESVTVAELLELAEPYAVEEPIPPQEQLTPEPGALTEWWRQLDRAVRSRFLFDRLWRAAVLEANARDHRDLLPIVNSYRRDSAAILSARAAA
jgi:hypothetical protein